MNQITEAFMKAGVPVPSTAQRLWAIIKDEGPTTAAQLRKRLPNIPYGSIGSKLHDMEQRGMIYSRGTKSGSTRGRSAVKEYLTDLDKYEVLPLPHTKRKEPKTEPQGVNIDAAHKPAEKPAITMASNTPSVEHLTIAQARELWLVLDKMFGGRK